MFERFDPAMFARLTVTFVAVPAALSVLFIWFVSRSQPADTRGNLNGPRVTPCILSLAAGFASAVGWLSWNEGSPILDALRYGAPTQFAQYQVIGCGVTLILLSGLITLQSKSNLFGAVAVSVCTAAGFATAFALDSSMYDAPSQEGIGVVFSYVGMGLLVMVTNLLWVAARTVRSKSNRRD